MRLCHARGWMEVTRHKKRADVGSSSALHISVVTLTRLWSGTAPEKGTPKIYRSALTGPAAVPPSEVVGFSNDTGKSGIRHYEEK